MRSITRLTIVLALLLLLARANATSASAQGMKEYAVQKTLQIGGEGGFDYVTVDADGKTLYLPRSTHTQVVDAATGKVLGDIPDNVRSHGVALVPEAGRGFISNGNDATVQVFDLKTNQSLGKIKAAEDADCIIYDPASKRVLAFCGDANVMVAVAPDVDPKSGKADVSLDLGGKPEAAVADGKGKVFVNLVDKDEVAVVDTLAMKVIDKWSVAPASKPVGMSMDKEAKRLFVGCRSQNMVVMGAEDGKVLGNLPIGAGVDGTAFHEGTAFASCGDGTLSVVRETAPGKYEVVQTVKTAPRAKTLAVDGKSGVVYLPTADGSGREVLPGTFRVLVVGQQQK
jgi:DNA-binding beta-propeller fold protein YncE